MTPPLLHIHDLRGDCLGRARRAQHKPQGAQMQYVLRE